MRVRLEFTLDEHSGIGNSELLKSREVSQFQISSDRRLIPDLRGFHNN